MSDKLTPAEAEKEFWKSLKESNTGMLGIDRPGYHHQPMTGFGEGDAQQDEGGGQAHAPQVAKAAPLGKRTLAGRLIFMPR